MTNPFHLLWLLLPIAALSGWWLGVRHQRKHRGRGQAVNSGYLQGLNFLLNEQADRAVDVFIKMLEVDSETVEIHLALANLFRRQGETERAIRLHQNLIARPSLQRMHRAQAELGLARDFLHAGLYDRAEALFVRLKEDPLTRENALEHLLEIYQQERDWDQAIRTCKEWVSASGAPGTELLCHFHCELAEAALQKNELRLAQRHARSARDLNSNSARALILGARTEMARNRPGSAYRSYEMVVRDQGEQLPLIWNEFNECARLLGREEALHDLLQESLERRSSSAVICALFDLKRFLYGASPAIEFLLGQVAVYPSGPVLRKLVTVIRDDQVAVPDGTFGIALELADRLLTQDDQYYCRNCGFSASFHHWQCPSCKHWDTFGANEALAPANGDV